MTQRSIAVEKPGSRSPVQEVLYKSSPLSSVYRRRSATVEEVCGWRMARHFGDPEGERKQIRDGAVLVDWSHVGKISLRGGNVLEEVARIDPGATSLEIGRTLRAEGCVLMRLVEDEFLALTPPGREGRMLGRFDGGKTTVLNQTGDLGCLVLAGRRRDEVLERSSTMNLTRRAVPDFAAAKISVHFANCLFYRTPDWDMLLPSRDFAEFVFDALMDVGKGAGLQPAGLGTLEVRFEKEG